MRIAHVVPRGERATSGVFVVLVQLAAALARRGHRVDVWSLTPWIGPGYDHAIALLDDAGVGRATVRETSARVGARSLSRQLVDDVDLVHLHGAFNRTNTLVSRSLTLPYVFSPHGGYDPISLHRSAFRKRCYIAAFERRMLRRSATIVALTSHEAQNIGALGIGMTPTVIIPNGVPQLRRGDPVAFRRSIGVERGVLLAVFVGRLDVERKGLDRFLAGLAASQGWRSALIGPEERGDLPRLRRSIAELQLSERVALCGALHGPELGGALEAADLFVLLSRWEGLPVALLEALAQGTPALVSQEVERVVPVAARGAGWVASPSTVGTMLEAIARDAAARSARAAGAIELARSYDWDAIAASYEASYGAALDSTRRRGPGPRSARR